MIFKFKLNFIICLLLVLFFHATSASALEHRGNATLGYTHYVHEALYPDQKDGSMSFSIEPELYFELKDDLSFTLRPFFRYDSADSERTHFDLREAMLLYAKDTYDVGVGFGKEFWGVTESQHLVDVINQTDLVESAGGEDKLGQPMLRINAFTGFGDIGLFVMPLFRERTFPGEEGRLRPPLVVDTDNPIYENSKKERYTEFAARYTNSLGPIDIGLSYFHGTQREPLFIPGFNDKGELVLFPYYFVVNQSGVDMLYVTGSLILKLEAIYVKGVHTEEHFAATTGFEYTFSGPWLKGMELGVLAEYLFDDRKDDLTAPPFEDDIMTGLRLAMNDINGTELLVGYIKDLDTTAGSIFMEGSRRITDSLRISLELYAFTNPDKNDITYLYHRDSSVRVTLVYFF